MKYGEKRSNILLSLNHEVVELITVNISHQMVYCALVTIQYTPS
jgi:hypothetical protein